jgi:hypothetical protein
MVANLDEYGGPERRKHRMYVTRNTEYHFRDGVCVAVRDRRSNAWLMHHLALMRKLAGAVRFHPNGTALPKRDEPSVGEAMYFGGDGNELVTSLLASIERPDRDLVAQYPS